MLCVRYAYIGSKNESFYSSSLGFRSYDRSEQRRKRFSEIFYVLYFVSVSIHTVGINQPIKTFTICFVDSFRTEDFGSECEVFAATSDTLNGKSGVFMSDMKETRSSEESYDVEKAKRLWTLSEQWMHQSVCE